MGDLPRGDSTSGVGVSAMELKGLDWANAEVVLLEDDTSEDGEQEAAGSSPWSAGLD